MEDKTKLSNEIATKFLKLKLQDFPDKGKFWVNKQGQPLYGEKVNFVDNYQIILDNLFYAIDGFGFQYKKNDPIEKQYTFYIQVNGKVYQYSSYSPGIAITKAILQKYQ